MSLSVNGRECSSFHFVGILGIGMSAIAQFARWLDCSVSGSDRSLGDESVTRVQNAMKTVGCTLVPQDGSGIDSSTHAVVVSSAIENTNPDIARAEELGIPVVHRSDVLAAIVATHRTVAVAGTSGKSTVTALCFDCLERCGKSPSIIGGANLLSIAERGAVGNAWHGESDILIVEADESDGTLVKYHPAIGLFLNATKDHKPVDETMELFATMASQSLSVTVNAEDDLCSTLPHAHTFGIHSGDCRPESVESLSPSVRFTYNSVACESGFVGEYSLANAMAAFAVCTQLGCTPQDLAPALPTAGALQRRFNRYATTNGITVIDDYAHNPAKIAAALGAAQTLSPRVFALFQPHGFGPTRFMKDELIEVFATMARPGDVVAVLPIYYAGGTVQRDISAADITRVVCERGRAAEAPESRDDYVVTLADRAKPGDIVLLMGARDPSLPSYAQQLVAALGSQPAES